METFSCATQTVNIDDHIVVRFETGTVDRPDDASICRMLVVHDGGETTVARFNRNGLLIDVALLPPVPEEPAKAAASATAPAATSSTEPKGGKK